MQPFTKFFLPFKETGSFNKIVNDYLDDVSFLKEFYSFDDSEAGIRQKLESYSNPRLDRKALQEVLHFQYAASGIKNIPDAVLRNIDALEKQETFTVTSGHQLNIFGGPLYVIYKLITTINLAEKLNSLFPANHFVPVYWMATEDHDIEEISSVNLFANKIEFKTSWNGPSGSMPLNGIDEVISELKNLFGTSIHAGELMAIISEAYVPGSTLAKATRKWVNELLGKFGLVILDGNEKILKRNFSDVMRDELLRQSSASVVSETNKKLGSQYNIQVNPRELNLFYMDDHGRNRIVKEQDKFSILGTEILFSEENLKEELNSHPEKFSPNVILRPLFQESVLPNIAFVGGPAELAYWLELKELFEYHHVQMPVLFLRCCVLMLEKNTAGKLKKLSVSLNDVFQPAEVLVKNYILRNNNENVSFQNIDKILATEFATINNAVTKIDSTLVAAVDSEKQKISASLKLLDDKIIRALKKKSETEVNQIRKLKEKLFPGGKLQERHDSLLPYFLLWGKSFIDVLKENLDPLKKEFIILEEKPE